MLFKSKKILVALAILLLVITTITAGIYVKARNDKNIMSNEENSDGQVEVQKFEVLPTEGSQAATE